MRRGDSEFPRFPGTSWISQDFPESSRISWDFRDFSPLEYLGNGIFCHFLAICSTLSSLLEVEWECSTLSKIAREIPIFTGFPCFKGGFWPQKSRISRDFSSFSRFLGISWISWDFLDFLGNPMKNGQNLGLEPEEMGFWLFPTIFWQLSPTWWDLVKSGHFLTGFGRIWSFCSGGALPYCAVEGFWSSRANDAPRYPEISRSFGISRGSSELGGSSSSKEWKMAKI